MGTPSSEAALRNAHGKEDDYRLIKDAILSRPTLFAYGPFWLMFSDLAKSRAQHRVLPAMVLLG